MQPDDDNLHDLPLEILHCLFEAFDPAALVSLALTNKGYPFLISSWLNKPRNLTIGTDLSKVSPGSQLKFICGNLAQGSLHHERKETAAVLREWQTKQLRQQGKLAEKDLVEWNVCNRCLKFKKQHVARCTRCTGVTCENFICSFDCLLS